MECVSKDDSEQSREPTTCSENEHGGMAVALATVEAEGMPEVVRREEPGERVIDISPSGCSLSSLTLPGCDPLQMKEMYVFDNVFTIFPSKVTHFQNLKLLKLFSNEVKYFPKEVGGLPNLEQLQVRASPLGLSSFLPLGNMSGLKALELHQVPLRPSASALPSDIAQLQGLKRLSICHFSISFLPPEIGSLENLEELDLSFNKLKFLPKEISKLRSLKTLKLASNKLVELHSDLSTISTLTSIDVGYNRLTSLLSLELQAMTSLQELNAQFNKLQTTGDIPKWVICNFEGNDWLQLSNAERKQNLSDVILRNGGLQTSQAVRKSLKRQDGQQQRARQNNSRNGRKHKLEEHAVVQYTSEKMVVLGALEVSQSAVKDSSKLGKEQKPALLSSKISVDEAGMGDELKPEGKVNDSWCGKEDLQLDTERQGSDLAAPNKPTDPTEDSNTTVGLVHKKVVRWHSGISEDNPKPSKRRKSIESFSEMSYKYSKDSFCGFSDYLPDGFYDAGRDRPFVPLDVLEKERLCLDSREIILVDRTRDEDLDVMASTARQLFTSLDRKLPQHDLSGYSFYRVAMLALFVSDCFGGSDKTLNVKNMRRAALGCTSGMPFVCSCCSTAACESSTSLASVIPSMRSLSEEAIRHVKLKRGSNVVPLGSLPYGVCRHRAILFKYLCDRSNPVIPCELVRGYLDYTPHAWNTVLVSRDGVNVRMLVDACRPLDIRLESNPEYFCRYIAMKRIHLPGPTEVELSHEAFTTLFYEEIGSGASGAVVRRCSLGGHVAAAKVRQLDDGVGNYGSRKKGSEGAWLSELRIHCSIGEHPCVVAFYGHQLSFDSVALSSATKKPEVPQLIIFMEYVKGGSLENLIKRFSEEGHLYTPPHLALHIAKSIARGLAWLHSRGILHRDIKSTNILVDVDAQLSDSSLVKICDFDSAVPVGSSSVHTCYLAHHGLPLTDVCVGTPRWIAPEVLDAMYTHQQYGLEADMWSFGCLLSELLTLQVPYFGIGDSDIHTFIKGGKRPTLTWKLDELVFEPGPSECKDFLEVLVHLYEACTQFDPAKRPTAEKALSILSGEQLKAENGNE